MGSRKQEEKNEKIIRGLMKLPPNRRCINCNSLGPQFVCTNFWTFVCMTCSGIHREFTHRVKSVSMSKFTSQEVEALQKGGNQRAREIYLKDWDHQRQRLPDNSNVDKVREFIKNIYVDKRYAGGRTLDKPPRDTQGHRSHEDDIRRASSYHSYSQSPPYDFQYEDRHYGRHGATLTRKPGSDRGIFNGKMSSFICSPTHFSERALEDRFANEGSISRVSDYSVSSGGDPSRYDTESPNFQKDNGSSSPPSQPSRDTLSDHAQHQSFNLFSEANSRKDAIGIPRPQRTSSIGSSSSFDSNAMSVKSYNSGSLTEVALEPENAVGMHQNKLPTFPSSFAPTNHGSLDLFNPPVGPDSHSSATSAVDLFQMPVESPAKMVDLFKQLPANPAPSTNTSQPSLPPSVDLLSEQSVTTSDEKSPERLFPKNEGWATFDSPQPVASTSGNGNPVPSIIPTSVGSSAGIDCLPSLTANAQWPPFPNYSIQRSSPASDPWHNTWHTNQASASTVSAQTRNALDNCSTHISMESTNQSCEPRESAQDMIQNPYGGVLGPSGPFDISVKPSYAPPVHTSMEEIKPHTTDRRSINPFDLPYDSEVEQGNEFLDMSSLQTTLPNTHLPSTLLGDVPQPWFPQEPVASYIPGGLAYLAGQTPSPQLSNLQTQEPVAFIGGNPFA
uniref:Arf-GAP domain-containing protein n=2 Tax=Rhizophora mucronata TaxID=61149 RepID=A0A2P2MNT6_RHIMU